MHSAPPTPRIHPLDSRRGRWTALLSIFLLTAPPAQAQFFQKADSLIHKYTGDKPDSGRTQFVAYPTLGYAPETTWEFGAMALLVFSAKHDFRHNRLSEVTALAFYTLQNQYGFWADHAIYTDRDKWYFLGRQRIQSYPLLYWGVGPHTQRSHEYVVEGKYLLFRQRVMHKVAPNLFAGIDADFQRLFDTRLGDVEHLDTASIGLPEGHRGSANLGLGPTLVYDTRHNYLNVRKGWFVEATALRYTTGFASDYNFTTYILDARRYLTPFKPKQTLALQLYVQSVVGKAPFNQLSLLGSEQLMRGYYLGRFRDNHYAAAQAEYRFLPLPFSKRFGATVFGALGGVAPLFTDLRPADYKWAAGLGARYLLLSSKDVFLRLDVAFTREVPGVYFFLGEAF